VRSNGFTLVEALFAIAILVAGVVALARVSVTATEANRRSRTLTNASVFAVQKIEQLSALAWGFDAFGAPVTDTSTDTTVAPARAVGGTGLTASPSGTLSINTSGYCDFVDITGRLLGGGVIPPAGSAFVRRWSIAPLTADPANALVIQVLVLGAQTAFFDVTRSSPDEARVTVVRTRKAS
jgi:hypothetical protein